MRSISVYSNTPNTGAQKTGYIPVLGVLMIQRGTLRLFDLIVQQTVVDYVLPVSA